MQLFPAVNAVVDTAANLFGSSGSSGGSGASAGFDSVLASFMEENRFDYSGRPGGFSGYGPESGTIDDATGSELGKELRRRNVSEDVVARLENLMASGAPATLGTIYNALGGKSRLTEALEGDERSSFKMLLGKLGFNADEQEELLNLSDDGDVQALMSRLSDKLGGLEGGVDLDKNEWALLLKGLDISSKGKSGLMAFFDEEGGGLTLSGEQLKSMLSGATKELEDRESATRFARTQMYDAMEQVLAASKARQQNAPVESTRGSRLSEQSEALMHDSVRRNTGMDELKDESGREESAHDDFEGGRDGKSRADRILATDVDGRLRKSEDGEKPRESTPAQKLMQRLDTALNTQTSASAETSQSPLQNTANLAQSQRQEIFSQVEQGILRGMANGSQTLSLQLNPVELGQLTVVLSLHQGELKATIRAENQDSAEILRAQLPELKATLEAEGLKVKELDVQTGLSDQSLAGNWGSAEEHNLLRDANERQRMLRLTRVRREAAGAVNGGQMEQRPLAAESGGLHIVA